MRVISRTFWDRGAVTGAAVLLLLITLIATAGRLMANPPVAGLDPEKPPGANFDLSHWYLGTPELPLSGSVEAADLIHGFTSPWFFTAPDGAMVFWAPVTGGTTPNSTFPRSELREQINPPDNTINWGPAGTHILNGQCKVTVLPSTGKIIIGQIHSYLFEARPLLKLVFDNGSVDAQLKESPTADPDLHYTFPNVPFNSLINYRIVYADGMLTMTINGVTKTANVFANDPGWATEEHYFKAGSYVQDNSGPSTEIGRVEFYQLSASHVGPARLPIILKQPASLGAQLKSDIILNLSAVGGLPLSYQWWKDGVLVPSGTNSILPLYNAQLSDSGAYQAVVTNVTGMITSLVGIVTVVTNTTPPTLGEALDATNLVWTTTGATAWTGNFGVAHDALDAARSPTTAHGQSSALQTTVSGPGLLTFWWKVSSETNADYLIFDNNSLEQARISGEVAWQKRSITIPAGPQVLKWTYAKNSAVSDGGDRGLVDEVIFQPLPVAITTQPANQTVDAGATVLLNVVATGTPPLSYQWQLNGIDLANKGNVRGATTSSLNLSNVTSLQQGNYSVVVSNATGRAVSSNALVIVNATVPLNEALDATNLVWITNGPASWAGRPFGAHDGIDAAQTRPLSNGQSATLQTTVSGPGTVTFWWKVSSETNADNLIFDMGGTEQGRISGEAGWQERTFAVATGSRVLRWTYAKNASGAAGLDAAWLDEVQFRPQPPMITAQPQGRTVDAFSTVTFTVTNTGAPPFSYQWRLNETNLVEGNGIRGSTASTLVLSNVQVAQSGNYSVAISNPIASVTSSNALLIVSPILTLAEALDATNLIWTTTGTPPWVGRTTVSHDGRDAASSGALAHGITGSFQTTVTGPGTVSFWWKVSSQPSSDRLMFYINGTELLRISGEIDWEQRTFPVPAGSQILSWSYRKNSSISEGQDRGWVDEVVYEPFRPPALPGNFSATAISMTQINLSWSDDSTNETAFRLERSTNGTSFSQIALLASNVTSYANTGLVGGLTFFYRLSATNVAGRSAYTTQAVGSTPWFNVAKINFQPASAPVPPGYVPDAGLVYGDRGNGLVYGFTASRSSTAIDRNSALSPDQRYDTYVSAGTSVSRFWELSVPNGAYTVLLVAGDAGSTSGTYRFSLEGTPFLNGTASSTNRWITARATTVVTDGRLSLGNVSGATDNKLCFVEISRPGPFVTCPADKTVESGSAWSFNPPVETTNLCGGAFTMSVVNTVTNRAEACGDTFIATRVWRSTDSCGNTNLCTQVVKVIDTTPPIIVPPGPQAVEAGTPWTFGQPMAFDLFSATPVAVAIVNTTTNRTGFCGGGFAATRSWSATDACGNGMLGTQTVSVTDSMLPMLLCAASRTVEAGTPWDFDLPGAPVDLGEGTNIALVLVSTVTNRDDFCSGAFSAIRTWRAADGCGNSSTCSQIITVVDITPPALVCATNRTEEAGSSWSFDLPSAPIDAGDGTNVTLLLLTTITNRAGFCGGTFVAVRTWSAIDACGNSNVCSQSILVQDTTPPVLVCADDRFVETGTDWTFDPPANPVDAGGTNVNLILLSTLTNFNGFCEGSYAATRTWLALDPCGNSNTCSQTVRVTDTAPPELVCATNRTVEAGTDWSFDLPTLTADAGGRTNPTLLMLGTVTNRTGFCQGTLTATRTWSVEDPCGNSNVCSQTVLVIDTTPPVLVCADHRNVEVGTAWNFDLPVVGPDAGSGTNITLILVSTLTNRSGFCDQTLIATRTWSATDACGNSNGCSQTITVSDSTPPAFICATNKTVEAGTVWTFDPPITPDPPVDGTNLTVVLLGTVTNTGTFCDQTYTITRTWSASDPCGNSNTCSQVIIVVDTTPPELLCAHNKTVEAGTDWTFDWPLPAPDAGSGTNVVLTPLSTVTNFGSMCELAFSITRTWAVRDGCGNSNTCAQSVTVVDTTPPTLDCLPSQTVETGSPWNFRAPSAIDEVDGTNVSLVILSTVTNGLCGNGYTVTRLWAAADACGNSNTCSQGVTVSDTIPPAVTPPLSRTIPCGASWTFDTPEVIDASDGTNVAVRIVSTLVDALGGDTFAFTRTWAVVDRCGNSNGCTQVITVADTTPPTILCMDTNTSDPCFQLVPVAVDACDPAPQLVCVRQDGQPMGALFPAGATVVTCAALDRSSNGVTCQFVVTLSTGPAGEDLGNRTVCANSDVTFHTTAPWSAPSVYVWKFADAIVANANTPTLVLSNVTVANAGAYCLEITGPCQSVTNCGTLGITNCLPSELCTLTPGFYANPQALWNGFSSQALLTNLIATRPLPLGHPGVRSLVIGLEDIPNLVPRLPARGAAAALPDNGDQRISTQPRNNKGRLDNALLGHALTLTLNTRLDNALGGFALSNRFCSGNGAGARSFEIPAPVLEALADPGLSITNSTVDGLITLANAALAGTSTGAASLSNITAALEAINLAFEGCRTIPGCEAATPLLPPNDAFANRLMIPTVAGQNTVVVSGWNVGATAEPGEPRHGFPATKSVWWQWRPAQSGWVTIRMTGSSFDTLLSVYTGNTLDQLTSSASSDDVNNLLSAEVVFFASSDMEYKFAVDGYDGDSGNIVLTIYKGILP